MTNYTDQKYIALQIARIRKQQLNSDQIQAALRNIVAAIDLTSLNATDNGGHIKDLCEKALSVENPGKHIPPVAACCVYPNLVGWAKDLLKSSDISVASVAGGFPSGQTHLEIKKQEVQFALDQGADEIDMVISRGKFLAGQLDEVATEISTLKSLCRQKHLKVILETGELKTAENVKKASLLAMHSGADFIKTSTGKSQPAATPEAFFVMLHAIREYFDETGKKVGAKAAGGISDAETALIYQQLTKEILGERWLSKSLFRIGASKLLDDIVVKIK
ncbi:MAG: deoxyribose-phosphate aldolase [Bacteroidales bacterium]|nr:deoxyribose-phosphate aldolase [Bacteroidales bacterium]MCF8343474.1 deoxyribose-phosphate aldolase [Bacteroidales bacterium]MCF8376951.1 deoxyribose-phosphate aldolase [Bacteroidales bacterium]MCF8401293.1 deoxyribose-phosphate aldolase [Bacteroidales bacterium]